MGYPLQLAIRYLGSKKRAFVSVGTAFAMLGVTLGVAALAIVMSVTGGFQEQFREKVLGVNAHVLVLKYSIDFREYRDIMEKVRHVKGVTGVAPFVINPMMVTHADRTATGVLLKGVDPELMPKVLDLPKHIVEGSLDGLRKPGAKPPARLYGDFREPGDPSGFGDGPKPSFRDEPVDPEATRPGEDAGAARDRSLMDAIARSVQDDARAHAHPAPDPAPTPVGNHPQAAPFIPADALHGSVTPAGGYASVLPPEDVPLPDDIDPDPCRRPELVAKLPGVVVGRTLAKQLNVGLGDCLQITSPTIGMSLGASGSRPPIAKQFRVISLYEAQAFYEQGDSVTGVEMKVDDIDHSRRIAQDIDKLLNSGIYHTMDWKELNHGLFTALLIQQIGMSIVLALIIVVAAFTVIATLIMVVLDKKKEIAVFKALGAKDDAVLRVFLYQGGIIGLAGTSLGLILGYVGCKGLLAYGFPLDPKVYFISRLPVNVRPTEFLITGGFAILICLFATIFPAVYAARLRPADGLRAE